MLTPAQQDARRGKLTGSRVGVLMRANAEAILHLYREVRGEEEPADLSAVWPVQLGLATEQLNLDWYESAGSPVTRRGEVVTHPSFAWATCTLDGWIEVLGCPIEAKHVAGREPLEVVVERYRAQCHWQMACTEATQCALSVIVGANAPQVHFVQRNEPYMAELWKRAVKFMAAVERGVPPVVLPPAGSPPAELREYDMSASDTWRHNALDWIQTRGAAEIAVNCERVLKAMVPDDASKCYGHGVRITRDRVRRLSLRMDD
ncbi:MAG: YqaJ viral recombinase family protein [Acetobacteraceae bacterium]|nr:YqaJ viral recombinase family protein [Acetobacteraceae bacterium]